VSEDRAFNINPLVLDRTIGKRFVEGLSGKGGLESLVLWMDQLDFVSGIEPLINRISHSLMFYDTALTKCAKENLKRPLVIRQNEISDMLGYSCSICGKPQVTMIHRHERICGCGGKFKITSLLIYRKLREMHIIPIPEAIMMSLAYDGLAEAYILAYRAFKQVLETIVQQRGWTSALQFVDVELKDRLDYSFYYGESGDQRISREEREILQFLVRGNYAGVSVDDAEVLIRLGIATCKFGHLFNQLFCSGADAQYNLTRAEFSGLYNKVNNRIRTSTSVTRKEREKRTITVLELEEKRYYAALLLAKDFWVTGKLSRNIVLDPIEDLQIFTSERQVAINAIIGPSGSGKTTILADIIAESFVRKKELVFNILSDEANSLTLAGLPLFPCKGYTGDFLGVMKRMGIKPFGMPVLNLTFLRRGEKIGRDKYPANPPTIFDYVVEIDDPFSFGLDFENNNKDNPGIINILEEIALKHGFKRVCGLINIRNLSRLETAEKEKETKPDIVVATTFLGKLDSYRQSNKTPSARITVDEASYLAPVTHSVAGGDTSRSSSTLSAAIKRIRKLNCSADIGTQKWSEINTDVRAEATNVFFRELPKAGDRARSQQDIVLDSLLLRDGKNMRELLASLMERGTFPANEFFWFWYNKQSRDVEVVKPSPAPFMLNQPKKTNVEVFRAYEEWAGVDVLLKSWSDVPVLRYENDEYFRPVYRAA
jgi:hypothetical protein